MAICTKSFYFNCFNILYQHFMCLCFLYSEQHSGFAKRKTKLKKEEEIKKLKGSLDMIICNNNSENNGK